MSVVDFENREKWLDFEAYEVMSKDLPRMDGRDTGMQIGFMITLGFLLNIEKVYEDREWRIENARR